MSSASAPLGVVETVIHRLVSCRAMVTSIEPVAEVYRLVRLAGEDLRGRRWVPGEMIQLGFAGLNGRAYTPHAFDAERGELEFLAFLHGPGLAADWLRSAGVGESLFFVGPRRALAFDAVPRPLFVFGDETSFSTAAVLHATREGMRGVTCVFEVEDEASARVVLERLGLREGVTVIARDEGGSHLQLLAGELERAVRSAPGLHCVFTGKAASIQWMYKTARRVGLTSKRVTNLAYWSPGRKGFSGVQR